ncbi:sodium channel and clathrin linker 1-like [Haliotis rufescens]|uniref:sodium channel and clathrin linker 1-like n=1 Tax=Haliotis rufescens TaxID=6454 RepID=UPI00201F1EF1|nr:sodium channel and clathrin linker 1-like [Haliotis rufescens]
MATQDLVFLNDQVVRLNALLASYQRKYPSHTPEAQSRSLVPSTTDRSGLTPLLIEYDGIIHAQEAEISHQKVELSKLRQAIDELLSENERLGGELRENVEAQLSAGMGMVGLSGMDEGAPAQDDDQMLYNFQEQLKMAAEEKESAEQKWRAASQEIDRLEKELEAEKESHQWRVVEQQAHQVKEQYMESMASVTAQVETLQKELRQARMELVTSEQVMKDQKRTISDLQSQLSWKDQEKADVIFKEGITDTKMIELKKIMDDLKHQLSLASRESGELKREKFAMETRVSELQRRNFELEEKETDAIMRVRDAVQMVENAVLEKDQAEVQSRQKDDEIEQMQDVVSKLINEAGVRTRQEVDAVRKQCNERIVKLTDEVHSLEMEGAEREAQIERLVREKRSVESELEKIYKDGIVQGSKQHNAYEDLNRRAIDAERRRDEAELKVDTLESTLKREAMNSEQLKGQLESQLSGTRERLMMMELEFENLNDDRVRYLDEIDKLKRQLQSAQQDKEAAQRKYNKQSVMMEQGQQLKMRDYEVKLQSTEDANRQTMLELRKLLNAQQRMSARWKEECNTITQKFEVKVTDLRSEVSMLKRRNEELTSLLKESQEKTIEAERVISEYTKNVRRMEDRVRESEQRAAESTRKLSRHVVRERQMTSERESLLQELTRSHRETNRSPRGQNISNLSHSGRLAESLRMADISNGQTNGSPRQHRRDIDDMLSER